MSAVDAGAEATTLVFFWGIGCPHCEEAAPVVTAFEQRHPEVRVERVEIRQDPEGRRRFVETMTRLDAQAVGIPAFVLGDDYLIGFAEEHTDRDLEAMLARARRSDGPRADGIALPVFGTVDPATVSLPALTATVGLVDGINPCAMWVLLVLLGVLLHVKSRARMILYAAAFIVMSGIVYFLFMAAWSTIFQLVGLSRLATMLLGGAVLAMGLVNLKELFWFKKGVSLVIPERAKPGLFRRMRAIAGAARAPAAFGGIVVLAFVVNLVELGCTIGLPAIYTRILSARALSAAERLGYLALYNVAYVVPLVAIAAVFIALRRRIAMTERTARLLKGVSGVLLVAFGALLVLAPGAIART